MRDRDIFVTLGAAGILGVGYGFPVAVWIMAHTTNIELPFTFLVVILVLAIVRTAQGFVDYALKARTDADGRTQYYWATNVFTTLQMTALWASAGMFILWLNNTIGGNTMTVVDWSALLNFTLLLIAVTSRHAALHST